MDDLKQNNHPWWQMMMQNNAFLPVSYGIISMYYGIIENAVFGTIVAFRPLSS